MLGQWKEVCYAVDEEGGYVLEPSAGWEPANAANRDAWRAVREEVEAAVAAVRAGRRSPLAVHMALAQMDAPLLAKYAGVNRWRVRLHLTPWGFRRLPADLAARYAEALCVRPEMLGRVPDAIRLPDGGEEPT